MRRVGATWGELKFVLKEAVFLSTCQFSSITPPLNIVFSHAVRSPTFEDLRQTLGSNPNLAQNKLTERLPQNMFSASYTINLPS